MPTSRPVLRVRRRSAVTRTGEATRTGRNGDKRPVLVAQPVLAIVPWSYRGRASPSPEQAMHREQAETVTNALFSSHSLFW